MTTVAATTTPMTIFPAFVFRNGISGASRDIGIGGRFAPTTFVARVESDIATTEG
jgi:hypothetical protein